MVLMKNSLFNATDNYTKEANDLCQEFETAMTPVWDKAIQLGYSPRELSHIFQSTIACLESEVILKAGLAARQKPKIMVGK